MFASTERPAFDPTPYTRWTAGVPHRIAPASYAMLPNHIREHYTYTPRVGPGAGPDVLLLEVNPLLSWFRRATRRGWRSTAAKFVLSTLPDTLAGAKGAMPDVTIRPDHVEHFEAVLRRLARATWLDGDHG